MPSVADAKKSCRLLERFWSEARNLQEILTGLEGAVFVAELDEIHSRAGIQAGDIPEQIRTGGVEFDADVVHAGNDGVIERTLESTLIDIVLVLADADGFWVDFDQFGERVHEAATDRNGTTHGEVERRKFLTGDLRGRINRGAGLAHNDNHGGCRQAERADEGLGLAGSCAIADGDGLDFKTINKRLDHFGSLGAVADTFFGIDHLVGKEFALSIEHGEFATGAEAGIDSKNNFLTER